MKKGKLLLGVSLPLITGFAAVAAIACGQPEQSQADQSLANIVKGLEGQTINTKNAQTIHQFNETIENLNTKTVDERTTGLRNLLQDSFSSALGTLAKIQAIIINRSGDVVSLKLTLSYPDATSNKEVSFTVGNINTNLEPSANLDDIFNNTNGKTFAAAGIANQQSPQEWEEWAKSVSSDRITTELISRLDVNFKIALGAATVSKVLVVTPQDNDATAATVTLTLSNGITTRTTVITVSPLLSQNTVNTNTQKALVTEFYAKLNKSVLVLESEFTKNAIDAAANLSPSEDTRLFESITPLTNLLPSTNSIYSLKANEAAPSIPNGYELRAIFKKSEASNKSGSFIVRFVLFQSAANRYIDNDGTTKHTDYESAVGQVANFWGYKSDDVVTYFTGVNATYNFTSQPASAQDFVRLLPNYNSELRTATLTREEMIENFPSITLGQVPATISGFEENPFKDEYLIKVYEANNANRNLTLSARMKRDNRLYSTTGIVAGVDDEVGKTITVSGFATVDEEQSKKDVETLKAALLQLQNLTTTLNKDSFATQVKYPNFAAFLKDVAKTVDTLGATITLGQPTANDGNGTLTFSNVTITKNNSTATGISLTISGFRQIDEQAKAWYEKWAKRTDWQVQQFVNIEKTGFIRTKLALNWNNSEGLSAKFNNILANDLVADANPTTLDGYNVIFNLQEVSPDPDATTLDVEYYLTKTVGNNTVYINSDGKELTDINLLTKSKITFTGIISDKAQLAALTESLLKATGNSGLYRVINSFDAFQKNFENDEIKTLRFIDDNIAWGMSRLVVSTNIGWNATQLYTNVTLLDNTNSADLVKIKQFMARPEVKAKLLSDYNAVKLRVISMNFKLNGIEHSVQVGVVYTEGNAGESWALSPTRTAQIEAGKAYEDLVE
ncbi:hypothetical protein EI74_0124 [Mycoplasma testudineum]|uniref:Lipoprotein-associated protein n=1 Tax=Mycoplasma testudineum TaxID=244584 RepID=A0A4R6IGB5_9MOLU|nr:hypothetical protein [Mycoplasma testudineum]OYD27142.1 hypothetical protein CG473_00665 [Mycoplasma testudineum]TDO21104.1 hypothetical protein EI74_0124 [Mycoplasma testudineum]